MRRSSIVLHNCTLSVGGQIIGHKRCNMASEGAEVARILGLQFTEARSGLLVSGKPWEPWKNASQLANLEVVIDQILGSMPREIRFHGETITEPWSCSGWGFGATGTTELETRFRCLYNALTARSPFNPQTGAIPINVLEPPRNFDWWWQGKFGDVGLTMGIKVANSWFRVSETEVTTRSTGVTIRGSGVLKRQVRITAIGLFAGNEKLFEKEAISTLCVGDFVHVLTANTVIT